MIASRVLPPPFTVGLTPGYAWAGSYPIANTARNVGIRQIELSTEEAQRWQTRLGDWNSSPRIRDEIAPGEKYGDEIDIDTGPDTDLDRIKNAWTGSPDEEITGFPTLPGGSGGSFLLRGSISLAYILSNPEENRFYPVIDLHGTGYSVWHNPLTGGNTEVFPVFSCSPGAEDWNDFGTVKVKDGAGKIFPVALFREPMTDPYGGDGVLTFDYVIDSWTIEPRLYIGGNRSNREDQGDQGQSGDAGAADDTGDLGGEGVGGGADNPGSANSQGGSLQTGALSSGSLTSGPMRTGALTSGVLSTGTITSGGIETGALQSGGLQSGGIQGGGLQTGGIQSGDLRATGGLQTGGVQASGVSTGALGTGALQAGKL